MERQEIIRELHRLVKSKNNDAVKLAYLGCEDVGDIGKLDLRGVVELKRSAQGGFEVKFVDRLKALELLERLCGQEDEVDMGAFLEGLRDGEEL